VTINFDCYSAPLFKTMMLQRRRRLAAMSARTMPLLAGATSQCGHPATKATTPSVCPTAAVILTLNAAGEPESSPGFEGAPNLRLG